MTQLSRVESKKSALVLTYGEARDELVARSNPETPSWVVLLCCINLS